MALIDQENENIYDEKIIDILTKKAKDYYKEIMCHRAIPDGRDGFTDVQRRIIWTCFENKWDKSKPHVKSAKVVGAVIADYHPHSNDSAYLTSAYLSQDWKQQIPLIEFHGSNGSISGADPAAMRYCVTKDALVSNVIFDNPMALTPIKYLIENNLYKIDTDGEYIPIEHSTCKPLLARNYQDKYVNIEKGFSCGKHEVIKMICDNGMTLTGTGNHPLLCMDSDYRLTWKKMEELKEGDKVLIKPRTNFPEELSKPLCYQDEFLARFYGYLFNPTTRIYIEDKNSGSELPTIKIVYKVTCDFNDIINKIIDTNKVVKYFMDSSTYANTNELVMIDTKTYYDPLEEENNLIIYLKQNEMPEKILKFFSNIASGYEKVFPETILRASMTEKILFLRTYLKDSTLILEDEFEKEYLMIREHSKKFLRALQILLLDFGILSTIKPYTSITGFDFKWTINITDSRSIFLMRKMIGFSIDSDFKDDYKKAVKELTGSLSVMDRNLAKDIMAYIHKISDEEDFKNCLTIEDFERSLNDHLNKEESNDFDIPVERYKELISYAREYEYVTIKKLTKKRKKVYSLRVDSEDHSFITNGFISHNTEQRLSKMASDLVTDELKSDSVDMIPNYSQDKLEPSVMPAKLPFLLVNGSFGIASGYITNIPSHNPREVIGEILKKLKDPEYKAQLLPDFPTGGTLCNTAMVKNAYNDFPKAVTEKKSKLYVRCNIIVDEKHNMLIIDELPYMTSANSIITSIKDAIAPPKGKTIRGVQQQPTITGISNIKNVTAKGVIKINIYCKRGVDLETLKSQLYRFTDCQTTIPLSFIYCIGEYFKIDCKSIDEYLDFFLNFRKDTIKRIKTSIIRQKKFRMNIIEGLFIILKNDVIEEVFAKIRKSKSRQEIHDMLMNDYGLNNVQAEKVSEYKLYQLASFAIDDLKAEYKKLGEEIEEELEYFQNPEKFNQLMIDEYQNLLDKYFTEKKYPRKTRLENISLDGDAQIIESIPDENYIMIFTKHGYVKKLEMVKTQKRNTKGISVGKLKDEDYVIGTTVLNSRDNILIFTANGKVYKYKVYEIPKCKTSSLGYFLSKDINGEKIVNILPFTDDDFDSDDIAIVSASRYNNIKITPIKDYKNIRTSGIISMKLREDFKLKNGEKVKSDEVIGVEKITDYSSDDGSIIALNSKGNAIRVLYSKIPCCGRATYGSILFANTVISEGYTVKTIHVVDMKNDECYFYISKNGLGKRMSLDSFEPQYRGTKGKIAAKVREDDNAEALITAKNSDEIIVVSNKNIVKVKMDDIPITKRPTYGSIVKKCAEDEVVIDISIDVTM